MDTKALRQKVLNLAIRGKLVPQNPNDEPASVLLERIRAEKQQMVKEGKLKAKDLKDDSVIFKGEDNLHYEKMPDGTVKCIENEIPFEVPEGWAWTRLGNICPIVQYGLSNSAEQIGTHRLLRITDIQDGKVEWSTVPFTTIDSPENFTLVEGDILFARTGATVGKSFLISNPPCSAVFASYLIRIRISALTQSEYIYDFFNSKYYWDQITHKSVGIGQPNCNGTALKELFVPLPPKDEQKRIVPTVKSLIEYILKIEKEKTGLQTLITQAKSKILNLAIRGKLVPQDPNDEPASVLLERIRAEKESLIKQGKIKREKNESFIFRGDDKSYYLSQKGNLWPLDELVPFNVPWHWQWCQLGEVCNYGNCYNADTSMLPEDVWILDLEDIEKNTGKLLQRVTLAERKSNSAKHTFVKGQVLYSKLRPYLNKVLIAEDDGCCTSEILPLEFNSIVFPPYARYILMSAYFLSYANQCSYGVKMPRLGTNDGRQAWIPIPPTNEQHRIVVAIETTFEQLDAIMNSLA